MENDEKGNGHGPSGTPHVCDESMYSYIHEHFDPVTFTSSLRPNCMALLLSGAPEGAWSGSHWRRTFDLILSPFCFSCLPVIALDSIVSNPSRVILTANTLSWFFLVHHPQRYIIHIKFVLIHDMRLYENLSPPNLKI